MKKLLVLPLLLMFAFSAYSQIGIRAGVNFANQKYDIEGLSFSPESTIGFQVGLMYEAALSDKVAFRPALLLNLLGAKVADIDQKFTYVSLPLDFVYKLSAGDLSVPIHAGPYLGFLMGVSIDGESVDNFDETTETLDYGLNVGAGVELMDDALLIGLNYGLGLANLIKDAGDNVKVTNNAFSIIAGYKF